MKLFLGILIYFHHYLNTILFIRNGSPKQNKVYIYISILQAYISNDNQHIKRFDKQKLISAAVLLGNAALSLEWVECRRKICLFQTVPRCLFIFLLLIRDSCLRSVPFRLNAVKHCIFWKSAAALLLFDLKKARLFGVALIRLNAIGYCVFSKETLGAHFCAYFYFSFLPSEYVLYVFLCSPASISLDTIQ